MRRLVDSRTIWTACVFALLLFTMLFRLTYSAPWGDEWNEYVFSMKPFAGGEFYSSVVGTFQPPLYNVLMHFWLKLGRSILWFRLFNIPVGFASGVLLFSTVSLLCSRRWARVAVLMLAVCYQWVYCVQECSEYALMLFFLFLAIDSFVRLYAGFSRVRFALFLFGCIGAIYCQYGAVFVAAPLLAEYFRATLFSGDATLRRKIAVASSYVAALVIFGWPLYNWFLKVQLGHNEISDHVVEVSAGLFKDFLSVPGQMFGYFYSLAGLSAWRIAAPVLGALLLAALVVLAFRARSVVGKSLACCTIGTYVLHYLLVKLQVYAMVRPGVSQGFLCRYSYFYLPLCAVVFSVAVSELHSWLSRRAATVSRVIAVGAAVAVVLCGCFSLRCLLRNWHKSYDDLFAEEWFEREGWKDPTYVLGFSVPGFKYFVGGHEDADRVDSGKVSFSIDVANLPDRFWVWQSNWRAQSALVTLKIAAKRGYSIDYVYRVRTDEFNYYILAFCHRE